MVSNMENVNPQVTRYLAKELQSLTATPLEGIQVMVNDKDITEVEALIDGPADTPYAGGRFRVKLTVGKDFPSSPPKGFFLTKIFHPNVSSKGEICVNTLKKDWKSDLGLKHILLTIKCLLIVPNPESALNEEAGKLLLERYDDYHTRAKLYTEIHAKAEVQENSSQTMVMNGCSTTGKTEKKVTCKKDSKSIKDKKKHLKRL